MCRRMLPELYCQRMLPLAELAARTGYFKNISKLTAYGCAAIYRTLKSIHCSTREYLGLAS